MIFAGRCRRAALQVLLLGAAMMMAAPATAQQWTPNKSLKILVPFAAGGTADIIARLLAQHLSDAFGQSVVVENRAGGGNIIATEALVRSAPDGYTLGMISTPHAVNATLVKDLPYDSIKSIEPLTLIGRTPILLVVNSASPYRSVGDMLADDKKGQVKLSYGSPGNGSAAHLAGELFKLKTGAKIVHVPYRGGGPSMNDLLANQIPMIFNAFTSTLPQVQGGKFRALAVADSNRTPILPDVPTFAQTGQPDMEMYEWFGMILPSGTPQNIKDRLHGEMIKFMKSPLAKSRLVDGGVDLVPQTPDQFRAYIEREIIRDKEIIERAGIKVGG
jgi:tripartite-type tricarboxylate transporter receptor subunit TctC